MSRVMITKEPELGDFGITPGEYDLYKYTGFDSELAWLSAFLVGFSVFFSVAFVITRDVYAGIVWGILSPLPSGIVAVSVRPAIVRFKRSRLLKSPVASHIKLYEEARAAYQEAERARWEAERPQREAAKARRRKLREHWMSLSGDEFERELGTLYRQLGYRVESTPSSGDQGVDLILRKNGKTTVVQCKSHQSPVGPAIVRELFGSLVAFRADNAILACTGGFTRGVKEFVRGKRIALVSASDLIGRKCRGQDAGHNEQSTRRPRAGMWKRDGSAGRETRQILGVPEIPQMQRD
jgi:HJR/Mrr/RecB family endonuclease